MMSFFVCAGLLGLLGVALLSNVGRVRSKTKVFIGDGGNTELREIERVGNYALSFTWGDSHSSGIYSFRYLRALGELLAAQGAEAVKALGELPRT